MHVHGEGARQESWCQWGMGGGQARAPRAWEAPVPPAEGRGGGPRADEEKQPRGPLRRLREGRCLWAAADRPPCCPWKPTSLHNAPGDPRNPSSAGPHHSLPSSNCSSRTVSRTRSSGHGGQDLRDDTQEKSTLVGLGVGSSRQGVQSPHRPVGGQTQSPAHWAPARGQDGLPRRTSQHAQGARQRGTSPGEEQAQVGPQGPGDSDRGWGTPRLPHAALPQRGTQRSAEAGGPGVPAPGGDEGQDGALRRAVSCGPVGRSGLLFPDPSQRAPGEVGAQGRLNPQEACPPTPGAKKASKARGCPTQSHSGSQAWRQGGEAARAWGRTVPGPRPRRLAVLTTAQGGLGHVRMCKC